MREVSANIGDTLLYQGPSLRSEDRMAKESAYRAAKNLNVTTATVVKWILSRKLKGRCQMINGRPFYFVEDKEVRRIRPAVEKNKKLGKKGVSLL